MCCWTCCRALLYPQAGVTPTLSALSALSCPKMKQTACCCVFHIYIQGVLPGSWNTSTQLQHIDLANTRWHPLPNGSWPDWSGLVNLQYLDLSESTGYTALITGVTSCTADVMTKTALNCPRHSVQAGVPRACCHTTAMCDAADIVIAQLCAEAFTTYMLNNIIIQACMVGFGVMLF